MMKIKFREWLLKSFGEVRHKHSFFTKISFISIFFYLLLIFLIVETHINLNDIVLGLISILISIPLVYILFKVCFWFVDVIIEVPKSFLKSHIKDLLIEIDKFISFIKENNLSEEELIDNILQKTNDIPCNKIHIWLYSLKNYRFKLITFVPAAYLLIVSLSLFKIQLAEFNILNNFFSHFEELLKNPYLNIFMTKLLPLSWSILVYQEELHQVNKRINKLELILNIKSDTLM